MCTWTITDGYRFADHLRDPEEQTNRADVPPPPSKTSMNWQKTDAILSLYWSPNDRFSKNKQQQQQQDEFHLTYGEVTTLGARQLAHEMGLPTESDNSVVFYDLGSGVGRLATQIYLDHPTIVIKSVGVELSTERHEIGMDALRRISISSEGYDTEIMDDIKGFLPVQLWNKNALECDLNDATHIYISSLCFPDWVLDILQERFRSLPHLKVVAALNRMEQLEDDPTWKRSDAHVQMSWGPGLAKVYKRLV